MNFVTMTNGYCKRCDDHEPEDWDFNEEGPWRCECNKIDYTDLKKEMNKLLEAIK